MQMRPTYFRKRVTALEVTERKKSGPAPMR